MGQDGSKLNLPVQTQVAFGKEKCWNFVPLNLCFPLLEHEERSVLILNALVSAEELLCGFFVPKLFKNNFQVFCAEVTLHLFSPAKEINYVYFHCKDSSPNQRY